MKRSTITRILVVALALAIVIAVPATAATLVSKTIDVKTGVEIYVDGLQFTPTDVNGKVVETFIYEGTTYLPARAIANVYDTKINWDGANSRVYIGDMPGERSWLLDVCPPYERDHLLDPEHYQTVTMAGVEYNHALDRSSIYSNADALFNLNADYDKLSFTFGHIDGNGKGEGTINIYLDGELAYSVEQAWDALPTNHEISLTGALQMKIEIEGSGFTAANLEVSVD